MAEKNPGEERYEYILKIPKERIAVLIGKEGEVKKSLEENTSTEINIDSKEGEVTVSGSDALKLLTAREIIKAVARGFNPERAMLLLKQDYGLEILPINNYAKTSNDAIRLKGRVIGTQGKARRIIESMTECYISVYGKTLSIIGESEKLAIARKALDSLLKGSPHSRVYRWLERQRRHMRDQAFFGDANNLADILKEEDKKDVSED